MAAKKQVRAQNTRSVLKNTLRAIAMSNSNLEFKIVTQMKSHQRKSHRYATNGELKIFPA